MYFLALAVACGAAAGLALEALTGGPPPRRPTGAAGAAAEDGEASDED